MEENKREFKGKMDWFVMAFEDKNGMCAFVTDNYLQYGFGDIYVYGRTKNYAKTITLINAIAKMQIMGDVFDEDVVHNLCTEDGESLVKFEVCRDKVEGNDVMYVYPYYETEEDVEDILNNGIGSFLENHGFCYNDEDNKMSDYAYCVKAREHFRYKRNMK